MSNFKVFPSLADLDSVFELRLETDPSANPTKLYYPGRNDLCLRYKVWTGGAQAAKTRYNVIQPDGTFKDLNEIFGPYVPPKGITWVAMGTGTNANVRAISAVDNSNVYVGGFFTNIGGDTNKNRIAKWDGATWQRMGTGMNSGSVRAISAVDNSNVYVGGEFTLAGGVANTIRIAKWDGATWRAMGTGTSSTVNAIYAVDNSNVYVGGGFTNIGGDTNKSRIARWDGDTWRALSTGASNFVQAIYAVDNSNVYVGGDFLDLGGSNGDHIARWDGATWRTMGSGNPPDATVRAIYALDNSNVYVGGDFSGIGGKTNYNVARWDGATWNSIGRGLTNSVFSIYAVDNSNVYFGGSFSEYWTTSTKVGATYIVKWDGATWRTMDTGTNNTVRAIYAVDNSNVYVGGTFTNSGGNPNADYIVKWTNDY